MGLFFRKKKNEPQKPKYNRIRFDVAGTKPYIGHIRYDLTHFNSEYDEPGEDGDLIYKYEQIDFTTKLVPSKKGFDVMADDFLIGHVPADKVEEVASILNNQPNCNISAQITGGEYKEYDGRKAIKGEEPYSVEIIIFWKE